MCRHISNSYFDKQLLTMRLKMAGTSFALIMLVMSVAAMSFEEAWRGIDQEWNGTNGKDILVGKQGNCWNYFLGANSGSL